MKTVLKKTTHNDRRRTEAGSHEPSNQTGLPTALKSGVEGLSGQSLDDVRVHYNSPKPAHLQANAFAQGSEIHVAPGQERSLPHEAWHVVQQKQGRVRVTAQAQGVKINDDGGLEREADVMGRRAAGAAQAAARPFKPRAGAGPTAGAAGVIQGDFWSDYQKRQMLKTRTPLPANRRIRYEPGQIVLEAMGHGGFTDVGNISYSIGPIPHGYRTAGLQAVPGLLDAKSVFLITGFYSQYEHQLKGVGGAMLHAAVKLAEARDCPFFVVLSGINHEVYEAFGFKLADPAVETWYASTAFMKSRTKTYATPTTGASFI